MHFDDRLETVLRLPASGDAMARIQFSQLIDIIGRLPDNATSDNLDGAFARLEALRTRIPAADRARLLGKTLQPIRNARLLALFADDAPGVASAAIARARLDDAAWLALVPALPVRARGILRHRRDLSPAVETLLERLGIHDRGLPPAAQTSAEADTVLDLPEAAAEPAAPTSIREWAQARAARDPAIAADAVPSASVGISAIVRRIEEFRKAREASAEIPPGTDSPRLPLGDPAAARPAPAIDFATDAQGRIDWADGPCAPALIGLHLSASLGEAATAGGIAQAMRGRLPIRGERLMLDSAPAVSGEWRIDAVPRFEPVGGRFAGYYGRLRRPLPAATAQAAGAAGEADRMREILHELRTPANAIQVAAEIIQQQLYGPAPHEYRALAAAIASDCAHILAGFEELDRLVKLETGALQLDPGECDLAQVLTQTVSRLSAWTRARRSEFTIDPQAVAATLPVPLDRAEAERLVWRLFAALAGATAPDETLALSWVFDDDRAGVRVALPAALAGRSEGQRFGTPPGERGQALSAGMFGIDFTLRLAGAEAAAAGGGLERQDGALYLWLPGLTVADAGNSTVANGSH